MTVDLGTKSAVTVERIALMKKLPHGEDNLGGRNRVSVEGVILDILKDVCPLPPNTNIQRWWSNSASCVVWEGAGKNLKIAVCHSPEIASEICRLHNGNMKEQSSTLDGPGPKPHNRDSGTDSANAHWLL